MKEKLTGYVGIWSTVAIIIVVGLLVTQGLLDSEFANYVFTFLAGGSIGGAAALKVKAPGG